MNKIGFILGLYISSLLFYSCNDSFLDYSPKDKYTEDNAFISYDNFKTYAWGLYSIFSDGNQRQYINVGSVISTTLDGDVKANYLYNSNGVDVQNNVWQWNNITPTTNTDNSWNFAYIRKVNIMLSNIDSSSMTDLEKKHWRAVGLFFRSMRYYDLLARYGDVPWLETVVEDNDTEILYGKRTPRDEVASNILRDLLEAEQNIKDNGDGKNTINEDCVKALLSRFCLFEGTWRKYHGLEGSKTYLDVCERVSRELIDKYPKIADNFVDLWSSDDLSNLPGIILYKECLPDLIMNTYPRAERGGSFKIALHARTVGRYLCQDGKPIGTSDMYEGKGPESSVYEEFKNRDHRLYWRCIPPYQTNKGNAVVVTEENKDSWWTEGMDEKYRYYIDYMNKINDKYHQFPLYTWQPHFLSRVPVIQTSKNSWGPMCNYGGYYFYMNYSTYNEENIQAGGQKATNDLPIFHIEEIMLNYAEVMFELDKFDQTIADITINPLRRRANVKDMKVDEINESFDPDRDPKVAPIAWEIRRERMVELLGEGFGYYDIRRWKRADYFMNQRPLGVRVYAEDVPDYFGNASKFVTASDVNSSASVFPEDVGRVVCVGDFVSQGKGWKDNYYLNPIPQHEISLNENLEQNPGW